MDNNPTSRDDYVRKVLAAYRSTPGTTGSARRQDRLLAVQLYERDIPLAAVENAFVLGAARRLSRSPDSPPLATIRSMHYFLGLIDEVLRLKVSPSYFQYLRHQIQTRAL